MRRNAKWRIFVDTRVCLNFLNPVVANSMWTNVLVLMAHRDSPTIWLSIDSSNHGSYHVTRHNNLFATQCLACGRLDLTCTEAVLFSAPEESTERLAG
jgi:hypothetical protein